jgi:hypothetical protein
MEVPGMSNLCDQLLRSSFRFGTATVVGTWLAILLTAAPSTADPVRIDSGHFHLFYNDEDSSEVPTLEGDFEFVGASTRILGFTIVSFAPGSDLNGGPLDRGSVKSIRTVVSGVGNAFTTTTEWVLNEFTVSLASPPRRVSCPDFECTVMAPFSLTGRLSATPYDSETGQYDAPFELSLLGSGTGVARFCCRTSEAGFQDALYTFGDTPAQTPEPASLVLAGIGLLGVGIRIHARHGAATSRTRTPQS